MPYQEKQIEKKYFTIGEVAEQLGVATSLLRFWEQEFPDYIKPGRYHKAGRKNRKYTLDDIEDVKKIYYLVKTRGFTLAGARQELIRQEMTVIDYNNVYSDIHVQRLLSVCQKKVLEFIKKENEALLNSIPPKKENPMTLDDYWNVKQELVSWLDPESAEEVEKYLAKLGYKIIKI
jgi:DNA-binding transcriptional MerR regulator